MGINKIVIICILIGFSGFSQTDTISNAYYKSYNDKIALQLFLLNTSNSFTANNEDGAVIEINPNTKTTVNLAFNYDFIYFGYGFAPRFITDNEDNKGATMSSFTFDLFPGQWLQHFDYYYQKGFTLIDQDTGESLYLKNLKSTKIGGSTTYFFNKNFSYAATLLLNDKQIKSAGSWGASLLYYYNVLNGRKEPDLGTKVYFAEVAVAPSYNYNWVISKNFLVASGLGIGFGGVYSDDEGGEIALLTLATINLTLGYNTDNLFCGINGKATAFSHDSDSNTSLDDTINYFTLYVGYRFDTPRIIKKGKEKIQELLKL